MPRDQIGTVVVRRSVLGREGSKRVLDSCLSAAALMLLSPILGLVALLVRLRMGTPVLFRQVRPGLRGRPFTILKFRTMINETDGSGRLLSDGERLTSLGRFLRNSSLDELPELFNVLKGDMSLVGPRPLFMKYLPYYTEREGLRHSVRPGITGWAQIHGRNYLPWDQRLALDVWYVQNRSLSLDLSILLRTCMQVIRRQGVAPDPDTVETDLDQERQNFRKTVETSQNG